MLSSGGDTSATSFEISPDVLVAAGVEPADRKDMTRDLSWIAARKVVNVRSRSRADKKKDCRPLQQYVWADGSGRSRREVVMESCLGGRSSVALLTL